ncbi:MAG: hypothetical protein IT162_14155 [Bryobacterales bacterium]|nr:hypothetical protein [Bryobacterales bacterium]
MQRAVLLVLAAAPLCLALFLSGEAMRRMRDELAWRQHRSPAEYLDEFPGGWYAGEAEFQLQKQQQAAGLIARLQQRRFNGVLGSPQTLSASWTADGQELLTSDGMQAHRWNVQTGELLETYGELTPARMNHQEAAEFGYGFSGAVFLQGGPTLAALTSHGRRSLWTHGPAAAPPLLIDREERTYEQLRAHGARVAAMSADTAVVAEPGANPPVVWRVVHPELVTLGFAPDGALATASRREVRWWRADKLERTVPLDGAYHPSVLSAEADLLLAPNGEVLEVWDTRNGQLRRKLTHDSEVRGACAAGGRVAAGGESGHIRVWSAATGELLHSIDAHRESVADVYCSPTQILSTPPSRREARLWDIAGRAQNAPVPEPYRRANHAPVRWGADLNLPGRFPAAADFAESNEQVLQGCAVAGMLAVALAAKLLLSARQPK